MFTGGIDGLEVCVPVTAQFAESFAPIHRQARISGSFRRDKYYFSSLDLRPHGIQAILHEHSAFIDGNGDRCHKLELVGVGSMNAGHIVQEVQRVFDVSAAGMRVQRVDFFVDLPGVTVDDLRSRIRFKYKRTSETYGQAILEREKIAHSVQTLVFGKRPDRFQCYDKVAERRSQFAKQKGRSADVEKASFLETYGHTEEATITRVERQLHGEAVPAHLRTLDDLLLNATEFNPFSRVEILTGGKQQHRIEDYGEHDYLIGRGIEAMILEHGYAETHRRLNRNRNAARLLKKYADFIPAGGGKGLRIPDLASVFRSAVSEQLSSTTKANKPIGDQLAMSKPPVPPIPAHDNHG